MGVQILRYMMFYLIKDSEHLRNIFKITEKRMEIIEELYKSETKTLAFYSSISCCI